MKKIIKKLFMRLRIPRGTVYCDGCPNWTFIETKKLHRDTGCEAADTCTSKCWTSDETSCEIKIVRCEYLDFTDLSDDTLLSKHCKYCGKSYPTKRQLGIKTNIFGKIKKDQD